MISFRPTWQRALYALLALGFAMSAYSSFNGAGPTWPNRVTFGIVATGAAVSTIIYTIHWAARWRRLMVASLVLAATSRGIGWALSPGAVAFRVGGTGALLCISALALLLNLSARRASQ